MFAEKLELVVTGFASTAVAIGIAWGLLRAKVTELDKKLYNIETEQRTFEKQFVTHRHLDLIVPPMTRMIEEIQKDIKKLLILAYKDGKNPD